MCLGLYDTNPELCCLSHPRRLRSLFSNETNVDFNADGNFPFSSWILLCVCVCVCFFICFGFTSSWQLQHRESDVHNHLTILPARLCLSTSRKAKGSRVWEHADWSWGKCWRVRSESLLPSQGASRCLDSPRSWNTCSVISGTLWYDIVFTSSFKSLQMFFFELVNYFGPCHSARAFSSCGERAARCVAPLAGERGLQGTWAR